MPMVGLHAPRKEKNVFLGSNWVNALLLHRVRLGNPLAGRATPDLLPRPAVGRAYLASQPEGQDNPDGFPESPRGGLGRGDR